MKNVLTGFLLLAALATPLTAYAEEPATAPAAGATTRVAPAPKELADTINKAVELLEAKKYREALELLAPAALIESEGMENMLPKFEQRARLLLQSLKEAQTQEPRISDDGRAIYPRSETDKERPPLRFLKIEEKWYMK